MARDFTSDFKSSFLRGLGVVLPTIITVVLIVWVFMFVQTYLGRHLNNGLKWTVANIYAVSDGAGIQWKTTTATEDGDPRPTPYHQPVQTVWEKWKLDWIGFVLAILAIYIIGRLMASFLGRLTWRTIERGFFRVPVVKQVYPYVKQVTDFMLSERKLEFSRVVAAEYPRKGVWSLGLVTGPGMRHVQEGAGSELLTVFIPSSPTPFTGYTIMLKRSEVYDLPISIDEALRFTVSGGVIMPISQELSRGEVKKAREGEFPSIDIPQLKETQA